LGLVESLKRKQQADDGDDGDEIIMMFGSNEISRLLSGLSDKCAVTVRVWPRATGRGARWRDPDSEIHFGLPLAAHAYQSKRVNARADDVLFITRPPFSRRGSRRALHRGAPPLHRRFLFLDTVIVMITTSTTIVAGTAMLASPQDTQVYVHHRRTQPP
jgi:hypothetical protein